ncbi:MAG: phosphotransferase [Oliverpabstia sp.]
MINEIKITVELAKSLIASQFPQYKFLDIYPVEKSGHDNRTFHLGNEMTVRLPSGEGYAAQVEKESKWLPYLSRHLDFPISKPLYMGKPDCGYPYPWSINTWIQGETLFECTALDRKELAADLAEALKKLQAVDCTGGPHGAQHNYYRGCELKTYHDQTMNALEQLSDRLPTEKLLSIWIRADRGQTCVHSVFERIR